VSDFQALFNTDESLWAGSRSHYKDAGTTLLVASGHVVAGAEGVVARFASQAEACRVLEAAGYKAAYRTSGGSVVYEP
jgi:hypothetical protein